MSEYVRSSLKTAAKGISFVFIGMAVSQALWFAVRLLVVRNLSKEDLGVYSLALGVVSIVSLLATAGLCEGAARYISILLGQGRTADVEAVERSSLKIGAIAGTGACVVMYLLSGIVSRYVFYKPELAVPLLVISFFIPAYVLTTIVASILRGYGNISPRVYFVDIGQPFFFLIFLVPIFLLHLSFLSIIFAYVCSMAVACALIAFYAQRKSAISFFALRGGDGYTRELLNFSVPLLSVDFMFLIFRSADTLMLGRYGTAEQVGVYSVSLSLATFLFLPLLALDAVYLPIAGELYAKDRSSDLARTYQVLTKWVFSLTLPVFFVLFFFPEMTIIFLFGERFVDAALPLRILSLGYLFNAFLGTSGTLLLVFGLSNVIMRISVAGAVLNVLLNYVLIKHMGFGIQGAAVASMFSFIAVSSGYAFALYRHSGIHPFSSGYLKPVLGSAVIGIIIYAAAKSLPLHFWMLPAYFLVFIFGYFASLVVTRSLDSEDVFLFGKMLDKAGVGPEAAQKFLRKISRENMKESDVI